MKEVVQHPVLGEIAYEESAWLGRKTLTVNGVPAQAISKREFLINGRKAILTGSVLFGVNLMIDGQTIPLSPKTLWYEKVLAILPFVLVLIWSNSRALCDIFPMVGGAIGGAIGGIGSATALCYMKKQKSVVIKLLISFGCLAATVFAAYAMAVAILSLT